MSELWNTGKLFDYAKEGIKKAPKVIGELSGALPAYRALKSTVNGKPESAVSEIPPSAKNVGKAISDQAKTIGKGVAADAKQTVETVKELPKRTENWLAKNEVRKEPQLSEKTDTKPPTPTTQDTSTTPTTPTQNTSTSTTSTSNRMADIEAQLRSYGFDENADEKTAQKNLIDMLSDLNLVGVSKDGNIRLKPYSPEISTVIQRSLGALSFALTLASGGIVPPIPISKLTGAEEKEDKRKEMWDEMSKRLSDVYGDILSTEKKGEFRLTAENIVKAAGDYERLNRGEAQAMEQQLQNALKQARQGADIQKELSKFNAELDANKIPFLVSAMTKAGLSRKDMAEWALAAMGSTSDPTVLKWLDYISKGAGAVGSAISLF